MNEANYGEQRITLKDIKESARSELKDRVFEESVNRGLEYPEDIENIEMDDQITEIIKGNVPLQSSDLMFLASDPDIFSHENELPPAFDGEATINNIVATAVYELVGDDLYGQCQNIKNEVAADFRLKMEGKDFSDKKTAFKESVHDWIFCDEERIAEHKDDLVSKNKDIEGAICANMFSESLAIEISNCKSQFDVILDDFSSKNMDKILKCFDENDEIDAYEAGSICDEASLGMDFSPYSDALNIADSKLKELSFSDTNKSKSKYEVVSGKEQLERAGYKDPAQSTQSQSPSAPSNAH